MPAGEPPTTTPATDDALVARAAELLRAEQFPAVVGPQCRDCPFEPICPAKSAGHVVSQ